jgi:predicted metal-dependent hydrolase
MLCPPEVLEYVVVHELCRRKHMDHSPAFWAEVERALPQYRAQRDWLKQHGPAILRRLPEKSGG